MNKKSAFLVWMLTIVGLMTVSSCKDESDPYAGLDETQKKNVKINEWVLANMDFWYYWTKDMDKGGDKSLSPDQYFETLLVDEDRFSWIQDNYQELLNSLKGITKESGYEFTLYKVDETSDDVIAQIVYIKPNSPATAAGLSRGDVITKVNGTGFTVDNYGDLLDAMGENHTIEVRKMDLATETFGEPNTISMSPIQYSENPNHLSTVIEAGNRKIGYYVYTFFANGPTDNSTTYAQEMDEIFSNFKAQGITDLVLDLRFNSGGAESAANNLASLIGLGVNNSQVFARRQYNEEVNNEIINDPAYGEAFLTTKFLNKTSNIGSQLSNGRVYILTGRNTASASELIINALKPYMDVFLIGSITRGKNVGSISLYDEEDPDNTWGMQPIVVKIFNSENQSDYSTGFVPDIADADNSLFLAPLGDPNEALLSRAIGHITGTGSSGRIVRREEKEMVGSSIEKHRRSGNLVIEDMPGLKK